jgi:hypothetical protein
MSGHSTAAVGRLRWLEPAGARGGCAASRQGSVLAEEWYPSKFCHTIMYMTCIQAQDLKILGHKVGRTHPLIFNITYTNYKFTTTL